MKERLQKILARAGYGSRRSCEAIVASRRVTVNERIATLGMKADIDHDRIEVDGLPIELESPIYIKLNKPVGVLSSTTDELNQGRATILDLVNLKQHLYPVGRLDKQSQGLMLLTNDGVLTHRLTHPRYEHLKVYRVSVEGKISDEDIDLWREGIRLDGKETAPAEIEVVALNDTSTWLQITLTSCDGWNHGDLIPLMEHRVV